MRKEKRREGNIFLKGLLRGIYFTFTVLCFLYFIRLPSVQAAAFDEIYPKLYRLEQLARNFDNKTYEKNMLLYLHGIRYNTSEWRMFTGSIHPEFEKYVKAQDDSIALLRNLGDMTDTFGYQIDFVHMMATIDMCMNRAPVVGGWGGDLSQIFIHSDGKSSNLYDSVYKLIGENTGEFNEADLNADLDAYNIYNKYTGSNRYLADVMQEYYASFSSGSTRYKLFVQNIAGSQYVTRNELRNTIYKAYSEDTPVWFYLKKYGVDGSDIVKMRAVSNAFSDYLFTHLDITEPVSVAANGIKTKMIYGDSQKISFKVKPDIAVAGDIIVKSGNSKIVRVYEKTLKAVGTGQCKIKIYLKDDPGISKTYSIRVSSAAPKITYNGKDVTHKTVIVKNGMKLKCNAGGYTGKVIWKSSSKIVKISSSGKITVCRKGICKVYVKCGNKSTWCKVVVKSVPKKVL